MYHTMDSHCRGDRIRTCDRLFPKQERYRAALHPAYLSFLNCECKGNRLFLITKTF